MLRPAGYVFVGRVAVVKYLPAGGPNQVATVQITFAIEQGLRGTRAGTRLTIRQWAALWNAGEYRVGERLAVFLYSLSRLGLTSAVGGTRGRLIIGRDGKVVLPPIVVANSPAAHSPSLPKRFSLREFTSVVRRAQAQEK